jgi:excinuclease ABC subunit B
MFKLVSRHKPLGDQPKAIKEIVSGIKKGNSDTVLMGVTGSGKTFTVANVIKELKLPTLVMAPNKTLAAQLYEELKELFPENCVSYFVSYYDYYQPEAYMPATNTYIEKDSAINDEIDKLRHNATSNLLSRPDVIIVASVSCIYGLGSPKEYQSLSIDLKIGENLKRRKLLNDLIEIQYKRDDLELSRGSFRVRGDTIDIIPSYEEDKAYRVELFDDEVECLSYFDPLSGKTINKVERLIISPASHFATSKSSIKTAIKRIQEELYKTLKNLKKEMKLEEAKRLEERTMYDIEMMEELGYCKGIENYSRHLTGRGEGEPPPTLIDYFPKKFLTVIDESHISVPQIGGMFKGDKARKSTLVEYGYRLPSALDNRPLNFEEFRKSTDKTVFVSATPGDYEKNISNIIVEQIIRPTGLVDPVIDIFPCKNQVDNLLSEIKTVVKRKEKVLVTTLTKKMAESLTDYYLKLGLRVKYLHSDISTLERIDIINDLRQDKFDVLIGINLLREGLDIPEVSLVAILDADKEGFLRSTRSLIQIVGRAARNTKGRVIMYADKITDSIKNAVDETNRRRKIQKRYNLENSITPKTITKSIKNTLSSFTKNTVLDERLKEFKKFKTLEELNEEIKNLNEKMHKSAKELDFEKAAFYRDNISKLKTLRLELG